MNFLSKLMCRVRGHKKGKRISAGTPSGINPNTFFFATFECPRCRATWQRKVKIA